MTNEFHEHDGGDDFNEHEIGVGDEGAAPNGVAGRLTSAWKTQPVFKLMMLIFAVFVVGIAAFNFLGGSSNSGNDIAHLARPPGIKEAPGGAVSPYMRQQTEMANQERSAQAIANGGSAIPTPIGQTADVGNMGNDKDAALNELRAETEQLKQQVQQQQVQQVQQQQQAQQQQQNQNFDNTLAEAMQRQMQQLMDSWAPKGMKDVTVTSPEQVKAEDAAAAKAEAAATAATPAAATATEQKKILVSAGTVSYAQMMTEANSDVPGPILAQIVSGPLSGARAIGSFQVSQGYDEYLVLKFSIADKNGRDYKIDAIALDPNTTLGGMATEVDDRYLVRVVLPAAAGFLQGMGEALGQGTSSITTNGTTTIANTTGNGFKQGLYNGMGQAANTMGQFFQNQANLTKPLVRVAAGTPMGLFFTAPVYDVDVATTPVSATQTNAGLYPGTTVTGYGNAAANPYGTNPYGANPYGAAGTTGTASGSPYPNYSNPAYGYTNTGVTRTTTPGYLSPYNGYSQYTGQ